MDKWLFTLFVLAALIQNLTAKKKENLKEKRGFFDNGFSFDYPEFHSSSQIQHQSQGQSGGHYSAQVQHQSQGQSGGHYSAQVQHQSQGQSGGHYSAQVQHQSQGQSGGHYSAQVQHQSQGQIGSQFAGQAQHQIQSNFGSSLLNGFDGSHGFDIHSSSHSSSGSSSGSHSSSSSSSGSHSSSSSSSGSHSSSSSSSGSHSSSSSSSGSHSSSSSSHGSHSSSGSISGFENGLGLNFGLGNEAQVHGGLSWGSDGPQLNGGLQWQGQSQSGSSHSSQSQSQSQSQGSTGSQSSSQIQSSGGEVHWQTHFQNDTHSESHSAHCKQGCVNGRCVEGDVCKCDGNWTGDACDEFECSEPCVHGHCSSPNTCTCNHGWIGIGCSIAVCESECLNGGSCTAPNRCSCPAGYSGDLCGTAKCEVECLNGGVCITPNICSCPVGFEGTFCQIPWQKDCVFPFEYKGEFYYGCTTEDITEKSLTGLTWCSKTTSFEGQFTICESQCVEKGQLLEIPNDCQHYHECNTDLGVIRRRCSTGLVFNPLKRKCDEPSSHQACSFTCAKTCENGGICVAEDTCQCPIGYSGKHCQDFETHALPIGGTNVCAVWEGNKVITFDQAQFYFGGNCHYLLVTDESESFQIYSGHDEDHSNNIEIKINSNSIRISRNGVYLNNVKRTLPFVELDVNVFQPAHSNAIIASHKSGQVTFDGDFAFYIIAKDESSAGTLSGLCGNHNADMMDDYIPKGSDQPTSDLLQVADSWKLADITSSTCETLPIYDTCSSLNMKQLEDVNNICNDVANGAKGQNCPAGTLVLHEACMSALCLCSSGDVEACLCEALTHYSRLCVAMGANITEWRTKEFCEMTCPTNMVHRECGMPCPQTCQNKNQKSTCEAHCIDGCFCPEGLVLNGDHCVAEEECPCSHGGDVYKSGSKRSGECEECICNGGIWKCSEIPCAGECAATGDPHFHTFDDLDFVFSGTCRYLLATDGCDVSRSGREWTFAVTVENVACGDNPDKTCVKSATLMLRNIASMMITTIKLEQKGVVNIDGANIELPYSYGKVKIEQVSNMMVLLSTSSGIEIEWDGAMRLYLRLQPHWKNKVCGLCGNFNSIKSDDMTTRQKSLTNCPTSFGNSWKTTGTCPDMPLVPPPVSCLDDTMKRQQAEKVCGLLKSSVFQSCNGAIDPASAYSKCKQDVCECTDEIGCACEIFSDYARQCSKKGHIVSWRNATTCPVKCDAGFQYTECMSACASSCKNLANTKCSMACFPGCICADGLYEQDGKCVEKQECQCYDDGEIYNPGETVNHGTYKCTCIDGALDCEAINEAPTCKSPQVYIGCSKSSSGVLCQPTCKVPDPICGIEEDDCVSGCGCPPGLVLEEAKMICVKPEQCMCEHDNKFYKSNETIKTDACNTCTCQSGSWQCTNKNCPAECEAWGDPHYLTFDGQRYEFQGDCSYVLVENGHGASGSTFRVEVENVPCGESNKHLTCSKSVTFYFYQFIIRLTRGEGEPIVQESVSNSGEFPKIPTGKKYSIRKGSIYHIVETNDGIDVLWDSSTKVKVKLGGKHMDQVRGLCGDFDGNSANDFQGKDGDLIESEADFGNSWKTADSCPDSEIPENPCDSNPERVDWAHEKCAIIIRDVFEECHDKVDPTSYYEDCLYDTCGCNEGGDCECFCNAVQAYAQACSEAGVCIHWRSNDVCPVMCEAFDPSFGTPEFDRDGNCTFKYSPCGNPCPPTCDELEPDCPWNKLEGCYIECEEDEVFDYEIMKCKPASDCPIVPTTPVVTTPKTTPTTPVVTTPKTTPTTPVVTTPKTTPTTPVVTTPKTTPTTPVTEPTTPPTTHPEVPTPTSPTQQCTCVDSQGGEHKPGESWPLRGDESLCMNMTCLELKPGKCIVESTDMHQTCELINKPICENGFQAVQVEDGCSCRWECSCYCFGQGDPHFFTFDGFYYPFQGNCTFVLSRDTNSHHSNHPHEYEIWMDNVMCPEAPDTTCTRKIYIRYNNTQLIINKNYTFEFDHNGLQKWSDLPIEHSSGIYVELRGISLFHVTIKAINLTLTYTGEDYSWSLSVPYSRYFDRTEGLCGLCNNNQADELTNRSGVVVDNVGDFALSWLVKENVTSCFPEPIDCDDDAPALECDILKSSIFEACHAVVDVESYYKICTYDTANCRNYSYCESLFGYAEVCQKQGVCVDWRSDDICPMKCPADRVYEPCRSECEKTCSNLNQPCTEDLSEGCFCPEGTILSNGDCVLPNNCTDCIYKDELHHIHDIWPEYKNGSCQQCRCNANQTVNCDPYPCDETGSESACLPCFEQTEVPVKNVCCKKYTCVCQYELLHGEGECKTVNYPTCQPGFAVRRTNPEDCVPKYECHCNPDRSPCPEKPVCLDGHHAVETNNSGCCPTYQCVCNKCKNDHVECKTCQQKITRVDECGCKHHTCEDLQVCSYNGTFKNVGEIWSTNTYPCKQCECKGDYVGADRCGNFECHPLLCAIHCTKCQESVYLDGECCNTCVTTGCGVGDTCVDIGHHWVDDEVCVENTCILNPDGTTNIQKANVSCPVETIPKCDPCYRVALANTSECCSSYICVPDDVCCTADLHEKQPGEHWLGNCSTCACLWSKDAGTGFNKISCERKECVPFDEKACIEADGAVVKTDDECCFTCDNVCVYNNQTYKIGDVWQVSVCELATCTAEHKVEVHKRTCSASNTIQNEPLICSPCFTSESISSDPCCPQYECICQYNLLKGNGSCPNIQVPDCPKGHVPKQNNTQCIPEYECVCDKSRNPCPKPPTCLPIETLITHKTSCCPVYECVCKDCQPLNACTHCQEREIIVDQCGCSHSRCTSLDICYENGTMRQPGDLWKPNVCTECKCENGIPDVNHCLPYHCETKHCDTSCPDCYTYHVPEGKCCGECVATGCHVLDPDHAAHCEDFGNSWVDLDNCEMYTCVNDHGHPKINQSAPACPGTDIPSCNSCYRLEVDIVDCCPVYTCVPENVCCVNSISRPINSEWKPSKCETCQCSKKMSADTGFHLPECFPEPCPKLDQEGCLEEGGEIVLDETGCCYTCKVKHDDCGRHVNITSEFIQIGECKSIEKVSVSFCGGYCPGSFYPSGLEASISCTCCNPTETATKKVSLHCNNGTYSLYEYEEIIECGCLSKCGPTPKPPVTLPEVQETTTTSPEAPVVTTTAPVKTTTEEENSGSGDSFSTTPEAPVVTTTTPVKTTTEEESSGSGDSFSTTPEAPVVTTTTPVKTTTEEESSGSGDSFSTTPEAPVVTTTTPVKTTTEEESSGSGDSFSTTPEAPVVTTTTPVKTTTEEESSGSGDSFSTTPEAPVVTTTTPVKTTTEEESSGSGDSFSTTPEAPVVTSTTPVKTTTEEESSGSGDSFSTTPEAPVVTTTTPVKTTTEEESSGSGDSFSTTPEAPVVTTTTPVKTTTEEESSGSGDSFSTTPEAPVVTTTPVKTTTEEESSGSGDSFSTTPEAPVVTTTTPVKTTTEEESSGSGDSFSTTPEAPVVTTTTPVKTTTEEESSGSGDSFSTTPEAPVVTTTTPVKTTTEEESSGSGDSFSTTPEAPVVTTTTPVKTTTEEESSGSGDSFSTTPEAPVVTTTTPVKTTTEEESSGSGDSFSTTPEAPVVTTTTPVKTTTEEESSGSGDSFSTTPEAPVVTTTTPVKTTTEEESSGSGDSFSTTPEAPVVTTTTPVKTTTEEESSGSGDSFSTTPEAPVVTSTTPVKTTTEEESSGSGDSFSTTPEAPVVTTTTPVKTTTEEESSGSGDSFSTTPEAPVVTTTTPVKTTTEEESSGSGDSFSTTPEAPVVTTTTPAKTTTEEESSGSGDSFSTTPEAPVVTTTTPVKTTTEEESSGSGDSFSTTPEAPVVTTTTPVKTTTEEESSGSGDSFSTTPEAPVVTTTTPVKTTTEEESSGSGDSFSTTPEAPVVTTTTPVKTTTEEESSGSGDSFSTTPEAPVVTTTTPVKTTTEEESSGSGDSFSTTPEAPVVTTTTPVKTTTEEESSGSGDSFSTTPEAPVVTTTTPVKTTTEEESSGSGDSFSTTPEAPVVTTTTPVKTTTEKIHVTETQATTTEAEAESTTALTCYWTEWQNSDKPKLPYRDDNETFSHIIDNGGEICEHPTEIECRPVGGNADDFASYQEWQVVSCDVNSGLLCRGLDQTTHPICENYEIRVRCCSSSAASDEVSQIQSQVQKIIDGIESNTNVDNADGVLAEFIQVKDKETQIKQEVDNVVQDLKGKVTSQQQVQAQHQIQSLNNKVEKETVLEHEFESHVKKNFDEISDSVSDVEVPEELNLAVDTMISDLETAAKESIETKRHEEEELKTALHHLIEEEHENVDNELKVLVDKTVDNLSKLEENHEGLENENEDLLEVLESYNKH